MIEFLNNIDTQVFLFFNGIHSSFSDSFMKLYSGRFIWIPMYAALAVMVFKAFSLKRALIILLGVGLAITLTDQTCATFIRPYVERLRPSNLANPLSEFTHIVNGYRGGRYGFPSCHAANSFALVAFIVPLFRMRNLSIMLIAWAVLNSYSRICLGVHYPGDLLVGATIGSLIGYGCYRLVCLIGFGNKRPHEHLTGSAPEFNIVTPDGFLSPLLKITTIRFRITDLYMAVTFGTILVIALVA